MELFKITCVTCRARLSVRDAALVGQIIGCPRCGMMVQVTPPAEALAAAAAIPAMVAATPTPPAAAHTPTFDDLPSPSNALTHPPAPPVATPDFEEASDALAPESVAEPPTPATSVAPATMGWATYKFPTLIAAGAIAGAAVVALGLTWFGEQPPVAAASNNTTRPNGTVTVPEAPELEAPTDDFAAPSIDTDDIEPPATAAEVGESLLPLEEPTPSEPSPATEPDAQVPVEIAVESEAAAEPHEEPSDAAVVAEKPDVEPPETQPRLRIDPLDVDPEGLDLTTIFSGRQKDPLAESQLPKAETPAPSAVAEAPAVAVPVVERAVRRDDRAGVGAPAAMDALLARRLPEVSVKKMPLCRLFDLSGQLSGLPVSVGPAELRMAAVSAATPASVEAKDATIEQLLSAALEPLRLQPVVEGKHIVLKRKGDDARRTVEYPVDDLATTPQAAKQLGDWVTQLVAPGAWQPRGGDATLTIDGSTLQVDAPVSVQYEALFVLERYRLTRDLPARTKYPSSLLIGGSFHRAVDERMSAPALFTFSQYTPIREVFRHWQEELEVAVLLDWPALAEERVWPQTRVACSGADKPWAEAMDAVLEPLGLAWRAVDRRTIEITTQTKVDSEAVVEFYRLKTDGAANGEQVMKRIEALAGNGGGEADSHAVFYDAGSRTLLTRLPAAVHRRIVSDMGDVLE